MVFQALFICRPKKLLSLFTEISMAFQALFICMSENPLSLFFAEITRAVCGLLNNHLYACLKIC